MIDTIQTAGPYVLAFWFGVALVRLGTVEEMERLNNEMAKDDH